MVRLRVRVRVRVGVRVGIRVRDRVVRGLKVDLRLVERLQRPAGYHPWASGTGGGGAAVGWPLGERASPLGAQLAAELVVEQQCTPVAAPDAPAHLG